MSYEPISEEELKCPCENGIYRVTISVNDWFQWNEHWEMLCENCKSKYILRETIRYDSGMSRNSYRWISIEEDKKAREIEAQCSALIECLVDKYLNEFLAYFSEKSKKEIWGIITSRGSQYPSLGTFYKHTKDAGLENYLKQYFQENIECAFEILNRNPPELEELKKAQSNHH